MTNHFYEVRPRKDKRGVDLISDALPFGGLWYMKPNDATDPRSLDRRFQFDKRSQLFIRSHNEALTVVTMRVNNPDRSPARIDG